MCTCPQHPTLLQLTGTDIPVTLGLIPQESIATISRTLANDTVTLEPAWTFSEQFLTVRMIYLLLVCDL